MATTPDPLEGADAPQDLILQPNGLTVLHIDGRRWLLRRPKLGEYKQLRLATRAMQDEAQAIGDRTLAEVERIREELKDAEPSVRRAAVDAVDRPGTDEIGDLYAGLYLQVFTTLATTEFDLTADELPAWASSAEALRALMTHFASAPGARGNG